MLTPSVTKWENSVRTGGSMPCNPSDHIFRGSTLGGHHPDPRTQNTGENKIRTSDEILARHRVLMYNSPIPAPIMQRFGAFSDRQGGTGDRHFF